MQVRVFKHASPEHAVRIQAHDEGRVETYPYMFPLPAWEGVEQSYHLPDFAMCEALHFMGAAWGETYDIPLWAVGARLDSPPDIN